jgi:hypothetical protein
MMDRSERQKIIHDAGKHFDRTDRQVAGRAWEPAMKKQILDRLEVVWDMNPDMRLGQMIANAIHDHTGIYYVEDFELADALEEFYEHRKTV